MVNRPQWIDSVTLPLAKAAVPPQSKPAIRPSDAATLIVIDRKNRIPKLLMGKRHPDLKFMPGNLFFPEDGSKKATP